MNTIVPPPMSTGDTIAIVPSARSIAADELAAGIALAESWGLKVRLGTGVGRKHFQQAGTAAERTADLQAAIADPTVKAIWCARGGYGTVHLMEGLDLSPLARQPKWVIGFSDITVLHNALQGLGIASLHAQMPFNIAGKSDACKETLRQALFGEPFTVSGGRGHHTGTSEGVLVGGNLSLLYALRGTPYDIDPRGKILFLEDLDELRYHMDRMIQNLKLSGWFRDLKGLIIGGMTDMRDKNPDDPFGKEVEEMIAEAVDPFSYPVCFGFPAGHIDDNRALVLGAKAKLGVTAHGATLSFGTVDV
ncbi:MAG: S66 peptidase family protein [Flavobacteriales bacterium]